MDKIRVLIADDHQLVREGIESMLSDVSGIEVIGLAPSGEEAINMARSNPPDVVLMDIMMPGMHGIEAARWIKEIDNTIRVIIVTMEISKEYVSAAIKSGVDGYLPKNIGKDVLAEGIVSVHRGDRYFNDAIKKLIFEDFYSVEKLNGSLQKLHRFLHNTQTESGALYRIGCFSPDEGLKDLVELVGRNANALILYFDGNECALIEHVEKDLVSSWRELHRICQQIDDDVTQ